MKERDVCVENACVMCTYVLECCVCARLTILQNQESSLGGKKELRTGGKKEPQKRGKGVRKIKSTVPKFKVRTHTDTNIYTQTESIVKRLRK